MSGYGLLHIGTALVSDNNPAQGDDDGMPDVQRCGRLHNYLVTFGWMAKKDKQPTVLLYYAVDGLGGRPLGLVIPADEHEDRRHPLESMLSNWIEMMSVNKIVPDPGDGWGKWSVHDIWRWIALGSRQVYSGVRAFD
ncbi:hypothetical protein FQN49_003568 [Arthroderma sp. PD_2]|nr:hypothetical protein FQN49_003568 [Arthroderma sp. PD_2]